jgi:hypothetical protein
MREGACNDYLGVEERFCIPDHIIAKLSPNLRNIS